MDLCVNKVYNVGFNGKKEILYGLKKAARIAKTAEMNTKAYKTSRMAMMRYEENAAHDASMRAYLDMSTNDTSFVDVIRSISDNSLEPLREIIKPEFTEHGKIEPLHKLYEMAIDVAQKNHRGKNVINAINTLFNRLK